MTKMHFTSVVSNGARETVPIEDRNSQYYYQNYEGASRPRPSSSRARPRPRPSRTRPRPPQVLPVYSDNGIDEPPKESGFSNRNRQSRCTNEAGESFRQVRTRTRLRTQYVERREKVNSLYECERECVEATDFDCRSFNYVFGFSPVVGENCELSARDSRALDVNNPVYFVTSELHDFYRRESRNADCIDVSQSCSEDGMVFTLRTPDDFRGRIYTYKHYDRAQCFVRGTGGRTHVLRIPGINGYPDCGTEKVCINTFKVLNEPFVIRLA